MDTGSGATGARSITVEDINKITKYDPENVGTGNINEYGHKVTYTLKDSYIYYKGTNYQTTSKQSAYAIFEYYSTTDNEWKQLENEEDSITLKSTYYWYYPTTLTTDNTDSAIGLDETSTEYDILFLNSSTGAYTNGIGESTGFSYWLESSYINTLEGCAEYGLQLVNSAYIGADCLVNSDNSISQENYYGVRPVVSLETGISLTSTTDGIWEIE